VRIEQRIIPFALETKSADGTEGDGSEFEGLGAVFNNLDWKGDILRPGCFARDIEFTRTEGKLRNEHGCTTGRILDAAERTVGLWLKNRISATTAGNDQRILVKDRVINRLSIGFKALDREWLETPEEVKSYWQSAGYAPTEDDLMLLGYCGCARLVTRAKVYEVSTTWLPVNEKAIITDIKGGGGTHAKPTFDQHSQATLAAVEEFTGRAERLKALRAADGRTLNTKALATLAQLKGRLETLLAATEPPAETKADDDLVLFDRYIAMGERLRGAQ
jgi:HK97 family phage prohead protease